MEKISSIRCRTSRCKAACCHNIPFNNKELVRFKDKIVRPILFTLPMADADVPFTDYDPMKNKCPFLRLDYKCNIYEERPEVCRLFGIVKEMPCRYQ